jgi:hypothetical protein
MGTRNRQTRPKESSLRLPECAGGEPRLGETPQSDATDRARANSLANLSNKVRGPLVAATHNEKPLQLACRQFGITHEQMLYVPQISDSVNRLCRKMTPRDADGTPTARHTFLTYLRASDAPEARAILVKYHSLSPSLRRRVAIETFCVAAGVDPMKCLEIIYGTAARLAHNKTVVASLVAAENQADMVEKSVKFGSRAECFQDREFIAKVTGLLPTPSGPSTRVTVNAVANSAAQSNAPPAPETMIRRLVDRFNERRAAQTDDQDDDD